MATNEIDIIKERAAGLSEGQKRLLIDFLAKSIKNGGHASHQLQFGKYRNSGLSMSCPEDFEAAEWHDAELNGN